MNYGLCHCYVLWILLHHITWHCCQLSQIIRKTRDFGLYLPVSHRSLPFLLVDSTFQHNILDIWRYFSYIADVERFLINSVCHCNLSNNVASYQLFYGVYTSIRVNKYCLYKWCLGHAIWRHLWSLLSQFSIFEDVGGWQPRLGQNVFLVSVRVLYKKL